MGRKKPTIEEKYNFLLQYMKVKQVDLFENDAIIKLKGSLYFQFGNSGPGTLDECVEAAMREEIN